MGNPARNFAEHLAGLAERNANAPAINFAGRRGQITASLSYGQLFENAAALANRLTREIESSGVVLSFPTGPEFITSFLACVLSGKTAIPIPAPRKGPQSKRIQSILDTAKADIILCLEKDAGEIQQQIPVSLKRSARVLAFEPLVAEASNYSTAALPGLGAAPDQLLFLQYTSGSTQDPKGVGISSANLFDNAARTHRSFEVSEDHFVNWMPHFHDMGLVGGLLFPLIWRMPSTQITPLMFLQRPADYLKIISAHPSVMSGGPAFSLQYLIDRIDVERHKDVNLASWRKLFCGGEPIPAGLFDTFAAHFSPLGFERSAMFATYGMAETTLYTAGGYAPQPLEGATSRFEGCRLNSEDKAYLKIIDPNTQQSVNDGETGEICVKGGSLGKLFGGEHLQGSELSCADKDGYYNTGDIGTIKAGQLFITGRTKDVLIASGQNFMASEIEWFGAASHPALNHLAAAAYQLDDTPDCFLEIELKSKCQTELDLTDIERSLAAHLKTQFGLPFKDVSILPRGSLPRTSSGKIKRHAVKQKRQCTLERACV